MPMLHEWPQAGPSTSDIVTTWLLGEVAPRRRKDEFDILPRWPRVEWQIVFRCVGRSENDASHPRYGEQHAAVTRLRNDEGGLRWEKLAVDHKVRSSARSDDARRMSIVHVANGIDPHPGRIDDAPCQDFMLLTGFPIVDHDSCHAVRHVEHPDDATPIENNRPCADGRAGECHRESCVVKLTVDVGNAPGETRRLEAGRRRQKFPRPHQPRGSEGIAACEERIRAKTSPVQPSIPQTAPPAVNRQDEGQGRRQVRSILEDEPPLAQRLADEPDIALGQVPNAPMNELRRPTRRAFCKVFCFEEGHGEASGHGIDRHPESCRASPDDDDVEGRTTGAVVGELGNRIRAGPDRRRTWHPGMIPIDTPTPCIVGVRKPSGKCAVQRLILRSTVWMAVALTAWMAEPDTAIAAPPKAISKPDFTKGDSIPEGATHDWNLGATGMRGWMYSNQMSTEDARQILVTKVDEGSPADGALAVGDVILGVGGKPFEFDPRVEFGRALTAAEAEAGPAPFRSSGGATARPKRSP